MEGLSFGILGYLSSHFDIPTFNIINCGKHSLRYQGPHIWSKLDNKLKGSSNIKFFKKNSRKKKPNVTLKQQQ